MGVWLSKCVTQHSPVVFSYCYYETRGSERDIYNNREFIGFPIDGRYRQESIARGIAATVQAAQQWKTKRSPKRRLALHLPRVSGWETTWRDAAETEKEAWGEGLQCCAALPSGWSSPAVMSPFEAKQKCSAVPCNAAFSSLGTPRGGFFTSGVDTCSLAF